MFQSKNKTILLRKALFFIGMELFVSKGSLADEKLAELKVGNWLLFAETPSYSTDKKSCHAVVIHKNWALGSNLCFRSKSTQLITLRLSAEGEAVQSFAELNLTEIQAPQGKKPGAYPVLLKLDRDFRPPFAKLAFTHQNWFLRLPENPPLWQIAYLSRTDSTLMTGVRRAVISGRLLATWPLNQGLCDIYKTGSDWKICSIPGGDLDLVLGNEYHSGAALLTEAGEVTGLGYPVDVPGVTMDKNYFIPLAPFERFIKDTLAGNTVQEEKDL